MVKLFRVIGAHGSSDFVHAESASAARKVGEAALGEHVVRVEIVEEPTEPVDVEEEDQE